MILFFRVSEGWRPYINDTVPIEKRVLVVDADAPAREMMAAVLGRARFAVDLCENGRQALAKLEAARYGAVILGLVRQDPSGDADILLHLKERKTPPPVIVISAGSQSVLDHVASDLIRARFRKPFEIDQLVGAVQSCFES